MRKLMFILIISTIPLLITSCGKETTNTQPQIDKTVTEASQQAPKMQQGNIDISGNYGVYDMSGTFLNAVKENPIDHAYKTELVKLNQSSNFTTTIQMGLESKFNKIWDVELNAIYNKILLKLSAEEKENLISSQKGWVQFHTKESEFVNQTFKLRKSGPILGSQGSVQMLQANKERIRERTLELMEYYSLLGGNVEFVYKE